MRCPTLAELPPPPPGKTGWPWTEESPPLPATLPDGRPWPRVSIVTPSYNQAQFLEETIRSVLLQGYPDLEYIICDGGSTDGSVEIIRTYEPWLAWWCSERDAGQADAINKGWARATGAVLAWLNSDDVYTSGAIAVVGEATAYCADAGVLYGDGIEFDVEARHARRVCVRRFTTSDLLRYNQVFQPSTFVRRSAIASVGMLVVELRYAMDYDLWLRLAMAGIRFEHIPRVLSLFRLHPASKTVSQAEAMGHEALLVRQRALATHTGFAAVASHILAHGYIDWAYYRRNALDIAGLRQALRQAIRLEPAIIATPRVLKLLPSALLGRRATLAILRLQREVRSTLQRTARTVAIDKGQRALM